MHVADEKNVYILQGSIRPITVEQHNISVPSLNFDCVARDRLSRTETQKNISILCANEIDE